MTHTPEPWVLGFTTQKGTVIDPLDPTDNLGKNIALAFSETDARRIVACVNACKSITTEDLESNGAGFWGRFASRNGTQRDQLAVTLKGIVVEWNRQKALFPELQKDGWMDLQIQNAHFFLDSFYPSYELIEDTCTERDPCELAQECQDMTYGADAPSEYDPS